MADTNLLTERAREVWQEMDDSARAVVRFGMIPFEVAQALEAEGYGAREINLALMQQADLDGGMVA